MGTWVRSITQSSIMPSPGAVTSATRGSSGSWQLNTPGAFNMAMLRRPISPLAPFARTANQKSSVELMPVTWKEVFVVVPMESMYMLPSMKMSYPLAVGMESHSNTQ